MTGLSARALVELARAGELRGTGMSATVYDRARVAAGWSSGEAGWGCGTFFRLHDLRRLGGSS